MPFIKNIGENAKNVVRTVVRTGRKTSRTPSDAALSGGSPISRLRAIFSDIIIPSSTIIPTTSIKAIREILSRNESKKGSRKKVPSIATGIPMATQKAVLTLRKIESTSTTRMSPIAPFLSTIPKLISTNGAWSSEYMILTFPYLSQNVFVTSSFSPFMYLFTKRLI